MAIRISSLAGEPVTGVAPQLQNSRFLEGLSQGQVIAVVAGAAALAAAAFLIGRRKAFRANGLLKASPEAFLMVAPITIPSYLGYRYAVRRMKPEDAALAEAWRDHFPSETDDEGYTKNGSRGVSKYWIYGHTEGGNRNFETSTSKKGALKIFKEMKDEGWWSVHIFMGDDDGAWFHRDAIRSWYKK